MKVEHLLEENEVPTPDEVRRDIIAEMREICAKYGVLINPASRATKRRITFELHLSASKRAGHDEEGAALAVEVAKNKLITYLLKFADQGLSLYNYKTNKFIKCTSKQDISDVVALDPVRPMYVQITLPEGSASGTTFRIVAWININNKDLGWTHKLGAKWRNWRTIPVSVGCRCTPDEFDELEKLVKQQLSISRGSKSEHGLQLTKKLLDLAPAPKLPPDWENYKDVHFGTSSVSDEDDAYRISIVTSKNKFDSKTVVVPYKTLKAALEPK